MRGKDIASPVFADPTSAFQNELGKMLSVGQWEFSTYKRRYLPCLCLDLRADGYGEVSAVPNYRESLRLDLDLEVSV